ncbi:MAG: hypothetical protein ACR2NX_00695 [Chthoniobacterales bacterium]
MLKRLLLAIFFVLCVPLGIWIVANASMWIQVLLYSGDGIIRPAPLVPGYQIEFPKFDASQPYSASYRLVRVPKRLEGGPTLYLRFKSNKKNADSDAIKKAVTAQFSFALFDGERKCVQSADLPVSTSTWWGGGDSWGVYEMDQSSLHLRWSGNYVLKVSYVPGAVPPPSNELHFSIEDGGTL